LEKIFGNIEEISQFQDVFFTQIEAAISRHDPSTLSLGDLIVSKVG
jgi:hypothetical protein